MSRSLETDQHVGSVLAGYRLDAVLGRGGMGVVYRAEHLALRRVVALKLVTPELAQDPRFRERFLAESRLAASLEHPNVIPIYDAGEADGELYLAMRIVEGQSLRELLAGGRLLPARALDLLAPVAAALDAAHALGLVHRDVKPANILIEGEHVYLSDFGLARLAGEARPDELTHLSGSLAYVAPEQATETAVDASADVYSLGCVLFECLTGEPPYAETSPLSLLWAHVSEPVPEANERNPELPEAIDAVLATALAKEPEERYAACHELTDAAGDAFGLRWLTRARRWEEEGRDRGSLLRGGVLSRAEASVAAAGPEALTPSQLEFVRASRAAVSRRQRIVVGASLALAAVAVVLLVFALISRSRATSEASRADEATLVAKSRVLAAESEAQLSVDPERSILLAAAAVRTSPTDEAVFALRQALDRSPLLLRLRNVGSQALFKGPGIAYSPDGKRLIEGSDQGTATVFDTQTGRVLRRFQSGDYAAIVGWSPDGSRIAVEAGCALTIRDAATYKLLATTYPVECRGPGLSYAFSPDGSILYYADGATVYRWNIRTKRLNVFPNSLVGGTRFVPVQVSLSPDGRRLAVAGFPGVELLDARSGRMLASRNDGIRSNGTIWAAFSPDGTQLAAAEWRGTGFGFNGSAIALLDGHTLARRATVARVRGSVFTSVAFSPDGARVAYGASDGTAGVYSLTGRPLVTLPGHTKFIFQVAFSPNGGSLATAAADGTTLIWRATAGETLSLDVGGIDANAGGSSFDQADLTFPGDLVVRTVPIAGPHAGRVVVESFTKSGARAAAPLIIGDDACGCTAASLSPGGHFAVAVPLNAGPIAGPSNVSMRIWDVAERRVAQTLTADAVAAAPRLSRNGSNVAFNVFGVGGSSTEVIETASARSRYLGVTACGAVEALWHAWDFSRDGSRLAAADNCGEVEIWNVATGQVVGRRVRFGDLSSLGPVRFSPDGKRLAVANTNNVGQVSIVDVATGRVVAVMTEHTRTVQDVAYSPDGRLLATAGLDSTARVWDARTGRPLRVIPLPAAVNNVAFSPDSRSLATLDFGGTVRVWDACTACADPDALLALADRRVTRELTPSERRTFGVE